MREYILHCKYFDCTKYSFWQYYVSHCNLAVIWPHILQPNIAISLKLYSSKSVTVMCTTNGYTKYSVWQCYVSHCNLAVNICSVLGFHDTDNHYGS